MQKRIMVIDDDREILNVVAIVLNHQGYEVVTFNSGNDILKRVKEVKPKIILLDIQLGDFDGRIICKEIKQIEEHSATPVILFSANVCYRNHVKDYLCDDFLEKPFEVVSLIEMMNKYSDTLN